MIIRRGTLGQVVEVESLEQLDELVSSGATSMRGWRLQGLDLTGHSDVLRTLDPAGALVLGGRLSPADERSLRDRGALLFPEVPELPFDAYRSALYTADELYAGLDRGYEHTPDATIYAWAGDTDDIAAHLAQALHDHAVDDALRDFVAGRRLVGVMGGHAARRGTPEYADAARLGRGLARSGLVVCTGGGPGAMEAANLGARAAGVDEDGFDRALERVAGVPHYTPSVQEWAAVALTLLDDLPGGADSLGIPTWFYGHEPPNVFASHIAKYFRNALREDTLLQFCDAGIVFLPGAAGTVQEIFQDACENYYAAPAARAPMVLVGRRYWTEELPAWPLLRALADRAGLGDLVQLVETVDEACAHLG